MNRIQNQTVNSGKQPWQLQGSVASLQVGKFSATFESAQPTPGLSALKWDDLPLAGRLLGVTADSAQLATESSHVDTFVRGDDLVANFAQSDQQSFSLQIYWRAFSQTNQVILLDTLISVQTELLESFPQIAVESQLASDEAWFVGDTPEDAKRLRDDNKTGEGPGCVVLRASEADWSYAEMSHPEDCGTWSVKQIDSGEQRVHRQLGGAFLEKGVIRLMRVRGAFLPRENDLQLAADCHASLASAAPPLTA